VGGGIRNRGRGRREKQQINGVNETGRRPGRLCGGGGREGNKYDLTVDILTPARRRMMIIIIVTRSYSVARGIIDAGHSKPGGALTLGVFHPGGDCLGTPRGGGAMTYFSSFAPETIIYTTVNTVGRLLYVLITFLRSTGAK